MTSQEPSDPSSVSEPNPWTFLAYGDSNTWGLDPATGGRLPAPLRWPNVAARFVGAGCTAIEEGLNGRTTTYDDPLHVGRSGTAWLRPCLETHRPLDAVVIMLGTNDLKRRFSLEPEDVALGIERLLEAGGHLPVGRGGAAAPFLVVAPPPIAARGPFAWAFDQGGRESEVSRRCTPLFAEVARRHRAGFLDGGAVATMSAVDGIHLDADGHAALGRAVGAALHRWKAGERGTPVAWGDGPC